MGAGVASGRDRPLSGTARCLVLFMLALLSLPGASGVASAADPVAVVVALTHGGEAATEVPLAVQPATDSFSRLVFVRQTGAQPIKGVKVFTEADDAVTIQTLAGESTFTIPPAGEWLTLRIRGSATARIDQRYPMFLVHSDGQVQPLGSTVHLTRGDSPVLSLIGGDHDKLDFTQQGSAFFRELQVTAGAAPVRATLEQTPLTSDASTQHPLRVTVDGQPVTPGDAIEFPAEAPRAVGVSSTLAGVGTYSGTVSFVYGEAGSTARLTLSISVEYSSGKLSVVEDPPAATNRVEFAPRLLPVMGWGAEDSDRTFPVTLRESGGDPTTLELAVLRVTRTDGEVVVQTTATAAVEPATLALAPRGTATFDVTVRGFPEPGSYTVWLRGTKSESGVVDVQAPIGVRDSIVSAGWAILLGTLLSGLLRLFFGTLQGRWIARVHVEDLQQDFVRLQSLVKNLDETPPNQAHRNQLVEWLRLEQLQLSSKARTEGNSEAVQAAIASQRVRLRLAPAWIEASRDSPPADGVDLSRAWKALRESPPDETAFMDALIGAPAEQARVDRVRKLREDADVTAMNGAGGSSPVMRWVRRMALFLASFSATAALAIIATMLGLLTLYVPNATWGSVPDWIVAFLWGLGLHQVSGAAADGIHGLRSKLVSS